MTFAHLLKYWGNETLAAGIDTNSPETLAMLYDWADAIILTEKRQALKTNPPEEKTKIFDVGGDTYPLLFNSDLLKKAKMILEENKAWLKNA